MTSTDGGHRLYFDDIACFGRGSAKFALYEVIMHDRSLTEVVVHVVDMKACCRSY